MPSSTSEVADRLEGKSGNSVPVWTYYLLFFTSGFPALLYQIVWQRALFTIYGVNVESVTIIVTVFMLGLGLGSLAGGRLSTRPGLRALRAFGLIELSIGLFGVASLGIFHRAASLTAGASAPATGAITFVLLLIPTLLMGSTLPLLVSHFVRHTGNVGEAVASLYCVNTLGSGVACFAAAFFVMKTFGESGSVRLAALLNLMVGAVAIFLHVRFGSALSAAAPQEDAALDGRRRTIPFGVGIALAAAVGFISLAYEIIWFRLYSFTSGGAAPTFAKLLGFYLTGIAYGSYVVRDVCRQRLRDDLRRTTELVATTVLLGSIAGFLVGPLLSFGSRRIPFDLMFFLVFIGAALLGSAFPILSHAVIDPRQQVGSKISYLYLGNIAGSALGSYIVGFVLMDHWSTRTMSLFLLALGLGIAVVLTLLNSPLRVRPILVAGAMGCAALMLGSGPLFDRIYERLLYKDDYTAGKKFKDLVENRSGVIAVTADETVFGGGVYDGQYNVDLSKDANGILRAYAVAGLHRDPKHVLIIGLSSGSWAQVVVNHPAVEDVTIVEINPGYLPLMERRKSVSSLLHNPKVTIVIDDGRRWLMRNPERRFDFILMNTSFHWRAHSSNLLSTEFLHLVRAHLNPGGIEYYNTTWSREAQATGATAFSHALRVVYFPRRERKSDHFGQSPLEKDPAQLPDRWTPNHAVGG